MSRLRASPAIIIGLALILGGCHVDWVREHPARLTAVTVEDVSRVASTLLAPAAFTGVVLGDLEAIGASLTSLGGVEL